MVDKTGREPVKKKTLVRVSEEKMFWCNDGQTYADIRELARGLVAMSQETFYHHVNPDKNDFSNWVRDIINDIELADALLRAASKDAAANCVIARLELYE